MTALVRESMLFGFLLGSAEALWEALLPDLFALRPIRLWHAWELLGGFGIPLLIFSGGLWAMAGGVIALCARDLQKSRRLLWAGVLGVGLLALICHIVRKLPSLTPAWILAAAFCLMAGWVAGGTLRLTGQRLSSFLLCMLVVGWIGIALHRDGKYPASSEALSAPASESPNVLIMSIDSLRADHLSLYGYPKNLAPAIDAFARKGCLAFLDCQSHATWTKPSVICLMTGRTIKRDASFQKGWGHLNPQEETLFERFHQAGYQTGWFAANGHLAPEFGLPPYADEILIPHRPFFTEALLVGRLMTKSTSRKSKLSPFEKAFIGLADLSNGTWTRPWWIRDEELRNTFLAWIQKLPRGQPWIGYIHFMAVHCPYGDTRGLKLWPLEDKGELFVLERPPSDSPKIIDHLEAYDMDIEYTDRCIGQILAVLEERGALEKTVVVITADHGEEFGEHGVSGHGGSTFHRGVTHVPLLLWFPRSNPSFQKIASPVQQIDLLPTLLALCGLPADEKLPGRNILPWAQKPSVHSIPWIAHLTYNYNTEQGVLGLRRGRYQFYLSRTRRGRAIALYDLEQDPREQHDVASQHPDLIGSFKAAAAQMDPFWTNQPS